MMGWYGPNGFDGYTMNLGAWGMMLLWMVLQLAFWGALIYFGVLFFRRAWTSPRSKEEKKDHKALELLEERFVKGEISEEEFRRMKEVLRQ